MDEVGGFCPELIRAQDFDLWIRIVEAGYRIVATREVLAVRRLHRQSWSSNLPAMARCGQLTYRRALERGHLSRREERIARRELRHQRLIEQIASHDGLSYRCRGRSLAADEPSAPSADSLSGDDAVDLEDLGEVAVHVDAVHAGEVADVLRVGVAAMVL